MSVCHEDVLPAPWRLSLTEMDSLLCTGISSRRSIRPRYSVAGRSSGDGCVTIPVTTESGGVCGQRRRRPPRVMRDSVRMGSAYRRVAASRSLP
ncbi:hypothetical protein LC1Hm_2516 [Halomicrobium sp. LC1Hm]|nr:hypothetical protein LC1Hm_2516 [Halomicrobium sp. LC1Hm]